MALKNLPSRNKVFLKKFLKNQNEKNELKYKTYKKHFESTKKRFKKSHFYNLVLKYKHSITLGSHRAILFGDRN